MLMDSPFIGSDARCTVHTETQATATCTRCGRFICRACSRGEPPFCESCAARRDPIFFTPFTFGGAYAQAFRLVGENFAPLLALAAIFAVPMAVLEGAMGGARREFGGSCSNLVGGLVMLFPIAAGLLLLRRRLEGEEPKLGRLMADGAAAWPRLFLARFRAGAWIVGATILLIIPGFMMWAALGVVTQAAMFGTGDPLDESKDLTRGNRWKVFGLQVSGFLLSLLGIAIFAAVAGFFVKLAAGAPGVNGAVGLGVSYVVSTLTVFGELFQTALLYAAYLGLIVSRERAEADPVSVEASPAL